MARCIRCNGVYSDSYLKDGVCCDCISNDNQKEQEDEIKKKSVFSDMQLEIYNFLKNKYPKNINIDKFFILEKYIEEIKIKYNITELNMDNYLYIETLLTPYIDTLTQKRSELVIFNDYSPNKFDLWNNEIDKFIENTFSSLIKANNIPIYENIIKDCIYNKIEENYSIYKLKYKSSNTNNTKNGTQINFFLLFFIFIIILIVFYIFSGKKNYSLNSSSDSSSDYQQRYNTEKAQTLKDIQKAVDEAKYQDWKNKR